MSVRAGSRIAKSFRSDGAKGQSIGNLAKSGRERDMFRWLKLPFSGYSCVLPFKSTAKPGHSEVPLETWECVHVILPSAVLAEIHKRSLENSCLNVFGFDLGDFWGRAGDEQFFAAFCDDHPWSRTYPLVIHEDGVPNYHDETATVYNWSIPLNKDGSWLSRNAIIAIPTSRMTNRTREALLDILSWDLKNLETGRYPHLDHAGRPFPANSIMEKRAGQQILPMDCRAVFCYWKGCWALSKAAFALVFCLWFQS